MQYVLLCDASYFGNGFVLMIEDYVKNNKNENRKTYAPVAFGSKHAQLKFSVYYKEFLALYFTLEHFSHYLWGTEKAVIVLTDNKSLTQFFQAKSIPPSLWNFLDRVLSYNLVIAHIPGRANYAADFLSRSQTDPSQTMKLKLTDRMPIREIEIESTAKTPDVSLSSLANIECLLEQKANGSIEMLDKLKQSGIPDGISRQIEEQSSKTDDEIQTFIRLKPKIPELNAVLMHDPADFLHDLTERLNPIDLKHEQSLDEVIYSVEDIKYASFALKKYAKQFNRLTIENDVLYRQFFYDTGKVLYNEYCLPKHLWKDVIYRLHNSKIAGHIGVVRTAFEFRKRFYFPGLTEYLLNAVKNCLTCIQTKVFSNKALKNFCNPYHHYSPFPGTCFKST